MSSEPLRGGAGTSGPAPLHTMGGPLQRCVAVPLLDFSDAYWSRAPLHSPATETGADFSDLFSESAVDELISSRGLRTPFVRMAKHGKVLDSSSFTRAGGAGATIADQAADDKVLKQLADGASLVLQGLHRTWQPLIDFGTALSAQLGHPAQINAYVTPAQSQGFSAHYDTHDVFVLQIAGRKRWLIHEPVVPNPLPEQTWERNRVQVAARSEEPPLLDVTLEPGDALYLPRGFLHAARALGELSIHLTVGVHPISRYDLILELLASVAADPELRGSLPMGLDLSDPAVLAPLLAEAARTLTAAITGAADAHASAVAQRVGVGLRRDTRPKPISPLRQLAAIDEIGAHSRVELRAGLRVDIFEDGEQVRVALLDRNLTLPAVMVPALRLLLAGSPVAAAELPGLPPDEQLVLVRRLLREAVIVPVRQVEAVVAPVAELDT